MTSYTETITLHVVYDETTGIKRIVTSSCYDSVHTHYRLVVKRWNALTESGIESVVKKFDSEIECVNWLNSLKLSPSKKCRDWSDTPTVNNLFTNYFPVEVDEPELAECAPTYRALNENEIILAVKWENARN